MYRWVVANILFPLHELAKGHQTFRIVEQMQAADKMSPAELESFRSAKLRDLIAYCYANVPYIRARMEERGIDPLQIRSAADLTQLPVMTKADMRANRAQLRSKVAKDLGMYSTTGSTGEPLIFDIAKRRVAARVASRQRISGWWGLSVGDPEFVLWGSPVELKAQDWVRAMRDRMMSTELLPAFEMSEAVMARFLDRITSRGCRQIFGYPCSIYLLCLYARKQGRDLRHLGLKAVFVTGEMLWPYQREVISDVMNCPVADGYGGRDSGFISHECPQGGMHILSDSVIVEILNPRGQPVAPGESGEITATDLYSHEAPFIRYATGDHGVLSTQRCRCGRALPLFEKIEGRAMEFFVTADGRTIPGGSVFYAFYGIDGIDQFRVVQKKVDTFHIQIAVGKNYRSESEDLIREGMIRRMRSPLEITFEYLPVLPLEPSGKFRCVVSEVAWEKRQAPADSPQEVAGH